MRQFSYQQRSLCDLASLQGGYWITIARVPRLAGMVLTLLLLGDVGAIRIKDRPEAVRSMDTIEK